MTSIVVNSGLIKITDKLINRYDSGTIEFGAATSLSLIDYNSTAAPLNLSDILLTFNDNINYVLKSESTIFWYDENKYEINSVSVDTKTPFKLSINALKQLKNFDRCLLFTSYGTTDTNVLRYLARK